MSVKDHPITRPRQNTASTTPRPHNASHPSTPHTDDGSNIKTPTKDSFAGVVGQRPLPSVSILDAIDGLRPTSSYSGNSDSNVSAGTSESLDVKMDDVDGREDVSDNESTTSDVTRLSKKKKSQKFFCTDFPPCQLSFTRSEHLARHIRKHTGERPFQCHCLRRFSRLDNLRQHAQTVHLNEDIPGDSLAATSTRFQRQIRTDRMRPPNHRARASTISSQGSHGRGHSRNWSGSSMGSVSDIASPDERRRPPPLAMAQLTPSRGGLTLDTYSANVVSPEAYQSYFNDSPGGYSTPTSVFSAATSSPLVPSGVQSPIGMPPRNYSWGERQPPGRRLSVPPPPPHVQQSAPGYNPSAVQYMSSLASSTASTYSQSGSGYASPASSVFSEVRQDPSTSESDIRRRTWHPGTYGGYGSRQPTSGLSFYRTPDAPQPIAASQPAAAQAVRLPGIDSFDNVRPHQLAPPRRNPSPMELDRKPQAEHVYDNRNKVVESAQVRSRDTWGAINQSLGELDITRAPQAPPTVPNGQARQLIRPLTYPAANVHAGPRVLPGPPAPPSIPLQSAKLGDGSRPTSGESFTSRKKKRQAWYNGPLPSAPDTETEIAAVRTSPEDSTSSDGVPTPSTNYMHEYHPVIVQTNGYGEALPPGYSSETHKTPAKPPRAEYPLQQLNAPITARSPHHHALSNKSSGPTDRLDALVAVATSEKELVDGR